MRSTLLSAQKMAKSMVAEAEEEKKQMIADAERLSLQRKAELEREIAEAEGSWPPLRPRPSSLLTRFGA